METLVVSTAQAAIFYESLGFEVITPEPAPGHMNAVIHQILKREFLPLVLVHSAVYPVWKDAIKEREDALNLMWIEIPDFSKRKTGNELRKAVKDISGIS